MLTPKIKRNLSRLLPFGFIWLVTGWVFLFVETASNGYQNPSPDTDITMSLPVFIYASIAVLCVGLLMGSIELIFLNKAFIRAGLGRKIVYKFGIYMIFIFLILLINFPIASSIELNAPLFSEMVRHKFFRFLGSLTFISTLVQLSFSIILSLLYAAISENIGHNVLLNFFTGKYHSPKVENRIFMFLDMKSSTAIAEKLTNESYFELLKDFYNAMSDAIINSNGEVYQYIGDEVVITWKYDIGIKDNNCLQCYFDIEDELKKREHTFIKKYNLHPDFKAGLHFGEVTTGEIGALKKEIFFTGDVLNTTSRIQSLCSELGHDLLLSKSLINNLHRNKNEIIDLGYHELKGKDEPLNIVTLNRECN